MALLKVNTLFTLIVVYHSLTSQTGPVLICQNSRLSTLWVPGGAGLTELCTLHVKFQSKLGQTILLGATQSCLEARVVSQKTLNLKEKLIFKAIKKDI